jgi:hypothetical protein
MFKILLGTWALAGILTSGLLTAVAQNPPAPPEDETTQESRPATESSEESSALDRQEDDVPREGDTTQLEQEADREEREQSQQSAPPRDERRDSEPATDGDEDQTRSQERENRNESASSAQAEQNEQAPLPGVNKADTSRQLGIQFRTSNSGRLMVSSVNGDPEAPPSLREGDVIVSAGGRTFESEPALREFIMREAEQDQIPFVVMRDGREVSVTWNREPVRDVADSEDSGTENRQQNATRQASIGAVLVNSAWGTRIAEIVPGSPAAEAGLQPGDFIIRMNGQPYASSSRIAADVARSPLDEAISLEIARGGQTMIVEARPQPHEVVYDRARIRQESTVAQNQRRRLAGEQRMEQRLAARPNFELADRVQELEAQVDALQHEIEQLRHKFNAVLGNEPGQGADAAGNTERDAENGDEQVAPALID